MLSGNMLQCCWSHPARSPPCRHWPTQLQVSFITTGPAQPLIPSSTNGIQFLGWLPSAPQLIFQWLHQAIRIHLALPNLQVRLGVRTSVAPPRTSDSLAPLWLKASLTPPWSLIPQAPQGSLVPWSIVTPSPLQTLRSPALHQFFILLVLLDASGSAFVPVHPSLSNPHVHLSHRFLRHHLYHSK